MRHLLGMTKMIQLTNPFNPKLCLGGVLVTINFLLERKKNFRHGLIMMSICHILRPQIL